MSKNNTCNTEVWLGSLTPFPAPWAHLHENKRTKPRGPKAAPNPEGWWG